MLQCHLWRALQCCLVCCPGIIQGDAQPHLQLPLLSTSPPGALGTPQPSISASSPISSSRPWERLPPPLTTYIVLKNSRVINTCSKKEQCLFFLHTIGHFQFKSSDMSCMWFCGYKIESVIGQKRWAMSRKGMQKLRSNSYIIIASKHVFTSLLPLCIL